MGYPGTILTLDDGTARVEFVGTHNHMHSVWVKPVSGDTVRVRYKVAAAADWETRGSFTAFWSDIIDGPVYQLEFQRTAGSGTTSTCGVA